MNGTKGPKKLNEIGSGIPEISRDVTYRWGSHAGQGAILVYVLVLGISNKVNYLILCPQM